MAGDLTEQTTRAQYWLKDHKWKIRKSDDFRPRADIQIVTRYIEGVPRQLLSGLVAYMVSVATETDPQIEGHPYTGTWTFSKHSWEKDIREGGTDNEVVFVQTMVSGTGATTGMVVEDGCAYKVTQTFYWDVSTLPTVPAGTSGIGYRLEQVWRDRETGLLSCVLEKRERQTQTIAQYTSGGDLFHTEQERKYEGVYDGDKNEAGVAITLDTPGNPSAGTLVQENRDKNDDCTQNIQQKKIVETAIADARLSGAKTIFEAVAEDTARAQPADTDLTVPDASGGVVTTKTGDKTPGGLLDVTTKTVTEQAVSDAKQSGTKTIFEAVAEDVDRNQPADTSLVVPVASGGVVTTKAGDKTPGGLLDVHTKTVTEQAVSDARQSGTKTIYEHIAEALDRNQGVGTSLTVPAASGGVVTTKSGDKTPGGLLDVTTKTMTEQAVSAAIVRKTKTAFADIVETVNRSQATAAADPTVAGESHTSTKTPGALYDQELKVRTPTAVDDSGTAKEIRDDETIVVTRKGNQSAKETEPSSFTAGKIVHVVNDLNDDDKWDTRKSERTADAQTTGWIDFLTRYGTGYVIAWRNQAIGYAAALVFDETTSNSLSVHINEFGLEDGYASKMPIRPESGNTTDTIPLGWYQRGLSYHRVKDDSPTTQVQVVIWNEYTAYENTLGNAESEADSKIAALAGAGIMIRDLNIGRIGLKTGASVYKIVLQSVPIDYSAWTTAPT
jgi:hypothetical protein